MADQIKITRGIDIESVGKDEFIHPIDGPKYGYYGFSPKSDADRESSTLAGVTRDLPGPSGTANVGDKPNPDAEKRMKDNTAALRGSK
jgi:hypothetical protein